MKIKSLLFIGYINRNPKIISGKTITSNKIFSQVAGYKINI